MLSSQFSRSSTCFVHHFSFKFAFLMAWLLERKATPELLRSLPGHISMKAFSLGSPLQLVYPQINVSLPQFFFLDLLLKSGLDPQLRFHQNCSWHFMNSRYLQRVWMDFKLWMYVPHFNYEYLRIYDTLYGLNSHDLCCDLSENYDWNF